MNLFDVFEDLNAGKRANQIFEDVEVKKVVAQKNANGVTIVLEATHLIDYREIKEMEKALDKVYFHRAGKIVKLDVKYNLSGVNTPETVWQMHRNSILEEVKNASKMMHSFVDASEDKIVLEASGTYKLIFTVEDTFINRNLSDELRTFLTAFFKERFSFDVIVDFEWKEAEAYVSKFRDDDYAISEYVEYSKEEQKEEKEKKPAVQPEKKTAKQEKKADKKEQVKENTASPVTNDKKGNDDKKQFTRFSSKFVKKKLEEDPDLFYGSLFDSEDVVITGITEIIESNREIVIQGKIIKYEDPIQMRGRDSYIVKFAVTDFTDTITCKLFLSKEEMDEMKPSISEGKCVKLKGFPKYDSFEREITISSISGIKSIPDFTKKRKDECELKRVELHAHTMMSDMDGVVDPKVLVKTAFDFGHPGVAITDHGVVQGFTDAFHFYRDKLVKSKDEEVSARAKAFKIIYGCEIYLVNDVKNFVINDNGQNFNSTTVVFDIETTGRSAKRNKIIEIGAVKLQNNEIIDRFSTFINPQVPIPAEIESLTHISDAMVADAPLIDEVLPKFLEFCGESVIVAHNAAFDTGFIKYNCEALGLQYNPTIVDTLGLAQSLLTGLKNYKLDTVADELRVSLESHHRAVDDAECTAEIYMKLVQLMANRNITMLSEAKENLSPSDEAIRNMHAYHCIVLCKNTTGRYNLYKMISRSHLQYFKRQPKIPKSLLSEYREGLIIGSACEAGELYRAVLEDETADVVASLCDFYDYYEIQPVGNNRFMIEDDDKYPQIRNEEDLQSINEKIVGLGEEYGKPVVATCAVHFLNPEDEVYRRLIMHSKGFSDADKQAPLYFRTTQEMLDEFSYLGQKKCKEVVVDNTVAICEQIEHMDPVRPEKCPPVIANSEETLTKICHDKAHAMYGEKLPEIVEKRLETELTSIIKNGYSVMYIIAQKLVWKSNEDGYLVGSRGSVGSSFVATMAGITEVNPLPAHYYCKKCQYSDFDSEEVKAYQKESICGFDMPDKVCPVCGEPLVKDGADIPFETFLGFNCDKEPDIDLNFSGEYQSKAHEYTEVIFGKGQTFKAGTVGTVAEKTAYGYALKYDEDHGETHRRAELERMSKGCVGVRRSTGQHPGGIIVLPVGEDIDSFTPVQHPANDVTSNIVTTHFDYHSIDHNLLKLDILGHDDPTMIKRLEELTGVDAKTIPMDDKKVISLFHGTEALGIKPEDIMGIDMGSLGLPELGTDNAMNMLRETKPDCFSDMVRISGLSHGTDVYANNAQVLIQNGTCNLKQAICTRDDIMLYLINKGVEPGHAFKIMESVRKGRGLTEEWEAEMKEHDVPDWYIWSCKKIQYMFPKAHACAYIMMAFRVAWFKVYKPLAYYAAYFGIRAAAFDYKLMCLGKDNLLKNMKEVKQRIDEHKGTAKDDTTYMNMKSVLEMYARGLEFMPIDLFKAKAHAFQIIDDKLMPSFDTIGGLGEKAADQLFEACKGGPFTSKENLKERAHITQAAIDAMDELGLLGSIPETDQISFADIFQL
ncbi:MAG: PolC-type DNA polymerase III [Lachnospiraceae bacterium]|nr:PolC-type DNA polymerase III [Lachnospiraceae bacterium]